MEKLTALWQSLLLTGMVIVFLPTTALANEAEAQGALDAWLENADGYTDETTLRETALRGLVEKGVSLEAPDENGTTPLLKAIEADDESAASMLIQAGADVNLAGKTYDYAADAYTTNYPLIAAARQGMADLARQMIDRGANPHARNPAGDSFVRGAFSSIDENLETLALAAFTPETLNQATGEQDLPLGVALSVGNISLATRLIKAGAFWSVIEASSGSVLVAILTANDEELISEALKREPIDQLDRHGFGWLHAAATIGAWDRLAGLLEQGANPAAQTRQQQTAVDIALTENASTATISQLLDTPHAKSYLDARGNTALHVAARLGLSDLAIKLQAAGSAADAANLDGNTALHLAAEAGDATLTARLLKVGADHQTRNKQGLQALHLAFMQGHSEVVDIFSGVLQPPAPGQPVTPGYDDPRIVYWSNLSLTGSAEVLLQSVEADLLNAHPHPFSALIWTQLGNPQRMRERYAAAEAQLKAALGMSGEIFTASPGAMTAMLDKYPVEGVYTSADAWALNKLADTATELGRDQQAMAYDLKALELQPDNFQTVWQLLDFDRLTATAYRQSLQASLTKPALAGTTAARLLHMQLERSGNRDADHADWLPLWLQDHPLDARLFVKQADIYRNLHRYPEAQLASASGYVFFPFYARKQQLAENWMLQNEYDKPRQITQMITRSLYPSGSAEAALQTDILLAQSLTATGDLGQAEATLKAAIAAHPTSAELEQAYAKLETTNRRYAQAAEHATKAAALQLKDNALTAATLTSVVSALQQDNQLAAALDYFKLHLDKVGYPTPALWVSAYDIAQKDKQTELAKAWLDSALQAFPTHQGLRYRHAQWLRETGSADAAIAELATLVPYNYWWSTQWMAWVEKDRGAEAGQALTDQLLRELPVPYYQMNSRLENPLPGEDKVTLAVQFQRQYPFTAVFLGEAIDALIGKEAWEEAAGLIEEFRTVFAQPPFQPSLKDGLLKLESRLAIAQSRKQTLPPERLKALIARNADCPLAAGLDLLQCAKDAEELSFSLGDMAEGARYITLAGKLDRDNTYRFYLMASRYAQQLNTQAFVYGYRSVQRNPYDGEMWDGLIHRHILWGGSSVVGLWAIDRAQALGLKLKRANLASNALGLLGDNVGSFESYSRNGIAPGPSNQYIDWYDIARRDVLFKPRKTIRYRFDDHTAEIEIVDEQGSVFIRRDDLLTGKPQFVRFGQASLAAAYSPGGQLLKLSSSTGRFTEFAYAGNGQPSHLHTSDGVNLNFEYNSQGRPRYIAMDGVGYMRIAYDAQGDMKIIQSKSSTSLSYEIQQTMAKVAELGRLMVNVANDPGKLLQTDLLAPLADATRDTLETRLLQAEASDRAAAQLELLRHLVAAAEQNPAYQTRAAELVDQLIEQAESATTEEGAMDGESATAVEADLLAAGQALSLQKQLYQTLKPYGLGVKDFSRWQQVKTRVADIAENAHSEALTTAMAALEVNPLALLQEARWLQKTDFANSGYWYYDSFSHIWPQYAGTTYTSLYRQNGALVLGGDKGLAVYRGGYWQWYGFDRVLGQFVPAPDATGDTVAVLALAETSNGTLWVGTSVGLMALQGEDYGTPAAIWKTESQGLPSPRIEHLASAGQTLYIGTPKGLRFGEGQPETWQASSGLDNARIRQLAVLADGKALIGSDDAIWLQLTDGGPPRQLLKETMETFFYDAQGQRLITLVNGSVFSRGLDGDGKLADAPARLFSRQDIPFSKSVHGLTRANISAGDARLTLLTDQGLAVENGSYLELMPLPYADRVGGRVLGPRQATAGVSGQLALVTQEGVYRYQPDRVAHPLSTGVLAIRHNAASGQTFIATGRDIHVVLDGDSVTPVPYSNINATQLAVLPDGALIANDGTDIYRFEAGSEQARLLFAATPENPVPNWRAGNVTSLLAASDGSLWVTAGYSVFRYKDGNKQEFSFARDPDLFPSRSMGIASVYETLQGNIRVVCSDTNHLNYKGVKLDGGLLQWQGDRFVRLEQPGMPWFVLGYTPIDEKTAILGTNSQFGREKDGHSAYFASLNDASHSTMLATHRMLWLGKQGVRLGNDKTWLFPTAGGLTVYHNGRWFYPDRLNQLLPRDQELGQYGGRTVHAVAVDAQGRIFAGTDLGLMIYQSYGAQTLLSDHDRAALAFEDQAIEHQQELRDVFLQRIPANTPAGKLVASVQRVDDEIAVLKSPATTPGSGDAAAATVQQNPDSLKGRTEQAAALLTPADIEAQKTRLAEREAQRQRLLAKMERDYFGLYQMLRMDPRELSAIHQQLNQDEAIVQYLPTANKLIIQVVTQEGAQVREVDIGADQLFDWSDTGVALLAAGVRDLETADKAAAIEVRGLTTDGPGTDNPKSKREVLLSHLANLYGVLLRPIERELAGKPIVYVNAPGRLNYLPFGALVRRVQPETEYAIERFQIGVMPSLFHLNLVKRRDASLGSGGLFIADPDGSLPGARQEVNRIVDDVFTGSRKLVGDAATVAGVTEQSAGVSTLHFATHGVLNPQQPEDSYLLMANRQRLSTIDIAMLQLDDVDLAVLSACESGRGADGLEFATIARAFALARVPTVIASLWPVSDKATENLMVGLYQGLARKQNTYAALAQAQRTLIKSRSSLADPSAWAAFTVFGKP